MTVSELYLDLLKKKLIDFRMDQYEFYKPITESTQLDMKIDKSSLERNSVVLCKKEVYNPMERAEGRDFPDNADSMIGLRRLNNLHELYKNIEEEGVEGDCLEAGVWKGGACIFLNALNRVYSNSERKIWVADSFEGLPPSTHKEDLDYNWDYDFLKVSLEKVKSNFRKYNLLDDNVNFLKGWFKDSLIDVEFDKLSILRVDGDMYESTMDVLTNLYSKVQSGGYVIIDDYFAVTSCKKAVDEFLQAQKINVDIIRIDWTGVFWKVP